MDRFVERSLDRLDYLAVIPDRAWIDGGVGAPERFRPLPLVAALLDQAASQLPVVLHSIGLSIGSAELFDEEYAQNLVSWANRLHSPWLTDHLPSTPTAQESHMNSP